MERWRTIPDFPIYMISEYGEVINKRRDHYVEPSRTKGGKLFVKLWRDKKQHTRSVDILVLTAFNVLPPNRENVNYSPLHIDGDQDNCHLDNLEWTARFKVMARTRSGQY